MVKLTIDNHEIEVPDNMTVLQAAESLGIEIPVFCYHPKLSIAGNCRMCLVKMEKNPKLIASCAMPAQEGMVIHTQTPEVKKARQGVLEFLLINHPLDCPICDQGGECDLQDITVSYGRDSSRYALNKRAVEDKDFGPLIETAMNRCIHCTRCIRFSNEIAGVPELGATGRGEDMEVGTYIQKALTSELSGNMIDICPVGALTSKPYNYRGRPWELSHTPSIDVSDAVGSAIRIDTRGREVMRILPRQNNEVNEDWISDKARFLYDGLKYQRLDTPYIRGSDGCLSPASWDEALNAIADRLQSISGEQIAAIVGDMVDAEAMVALKDLMNALGSPHIDCRQDGTNSGIEHRSTYLFNTTISGVEQADFCLLIGTNPRWEAPLVNARIRKNYLLSGLPVASIGLLHDLGYPVNHLGNNPFLLEEILEGKHPIAASLKVAKYPMLILGQGALRRADSDHLLYLTHEIAQKYGFIQQNSSYGQDQWNGFNILHLAASRVGGLDLGLVPGRNGYSTMEIFEAVKEKKVKLVYLLGADEIEPSRLKSAFVIYQGHHGDRGASCADVILPGATYTEKSGTYVNTEGRVQRSLQAVSPPGNAKEDWKIIRALSDKLEHKLPYDSLEEVRERLVEVNPLFDELDTVQRASWPNQCGRKGEISSEPFKPVIENFYMTDPISRHSITMAKCTQGLIHG